MSNDVFHDLLARSLRGLFTVPPALNPTDADIQWYKEHTRVFRDPIALPLERREDKMCWRNAAHALWANMDLLYVQGLVQGRGRELVAHAWCTDSTGALFEPTWDVQNATGAEHYVGVPFTLDQVVRLQDYFGRYGWYDGFADVLTAATVESPA